MKKAISPLFCLLFAMTVFLPVGTIVCACFGYTFALINVSAFAVAIAVLSVCTDVLDLIFKCTVENKILQILIAAITPLSLINAVFFIFACSRILVIVSVFISAVCCFFLTIRHGKPAVLKTVALILSALMILPIGVFSFVTTTFGNIGHETVVQTLESPNGKYYAEVVDCDQGAFGGDTTVEVYEKFKINAILFTIEKKPQYVYFGEWGEYKDMQICWKDDRCLVINSTEYKIE